MLRYSNAQSPFISFFLLIVLVIFSSCFLEPSEPEERSFPNVDQRLWHLFEAYEIEGAKRGFDIDLVAERITGDIQAIDEEHIAGQCHYSNINPGVVTVDSEFWANSSENFKEFIVFHELGHCHLMRDHREDFDENGFCISIMRSGLENCRDRYNMLTREEYLDELFFPESF